MRVELTFILAYDIHSLFFKLCYTYSRIFSNTPKNKLQPPTSQESKNSGWGVEES